MIFEGEKKDLELTSTSTTISMIEQESNALVYLRVPR